jgi:hypothetical protein
LAGKALAVLRSLRWCIKMNKIEEFRIWPVMRAAPKIHYRENRCVIDPGSRADLKIEFNSKAGNGGSKPRLTPSVCRTT